MGADLYLWESFKKHEEQYKETKEEAIAKRNAMENKYTEEYQAACDEVERIYNLIFESDYYFRDSYNDGIFLNKIGLSWWQDVSPRCRKRDRMLPLRQAKWLLNQIRKGYKKDFEKNFEIFCQKSIVEENPEKFEEEKKLWLEFYQNRFAKLQKMLELSIETKELIYCSL